MQPSLTVRFARAALSVWPCRFKTTMHDDGGAVRGYCAVKKWSLSQSRGLWPKSCAQVDKWTSGVDKLSSNPEEKNSSRLVAPWWEIFKMTLTAVLTFFYSNLSQIGWWWWWCSPGATFLLHFPLVIFFLHSSTLLLLPTISAEIIIFCCSSPRI